MRRANGKSFQCQKSSRIDLYTHTRSQARGTSMCGVWLQSRMTGTLSNKRHKQQAVIANTWTPVLPLMSGQYSGSFPCRRHDRTEKEEYSNTVTLPFCASAAWYSNCRQRSAERPWWFLVLSERRGVRRALDPHLWSENHRGKLMRTFCKVISYLLHTFSAPPQLTAATAKLSITGSEITRSKKKHYVIPSH